MKNPFAKSRPNPKRTEPRRVGPDRVRLKGEDMTELRRQAYYRSGGFCEAIVANGVRSGRCWRPITWESMELSHNRHAANKSDELSQVLASCKECHQIGKHNPKSCPRRPGSVMSLKAAREYWLGEVCFCDGPEHKGEKHKRESFCAECRSKVLPQTAYDLENSDSAKDYCETVARAEMEILAADLKARTA